MALLIAVVAPWGAARPAHAQPDPARGQAGTAQVLPAGQIDLARLVDLAADRLNVTIEYDASVLKGVVTLRVAQGLSDQELWVLTNRVLAERGFTTVRAPGGTGLAVVKLSDAKGMAVATGGFAAEREEERRAAEILPGYTSALVRVRHRAVKEIVDAVKVVLSKEGGNSSALGDSGLIVVSDLTPHVDQARALITALDTPSEPAVAEVESKYLTPAQLVALLQQVTAKRTAAGGEAVKGEVLANPNASSVLVISPPDRVVYWKDLIATLDKREPVETATYAPKYFGVKEVAKLVEQSVKEGPTAAATDDRFRIITDDLTGSLIVTATPSQHEGIKELLQRLDSVSAGTRKPVRTYLIRNRPVTDVLNVLQQLMEAGVLDAAAVETGLSTSQPRAPTPAASSLQQNPSGAGAQSQIVPPPVEPSPAPATTAPADRSAPRADGTEYRPSRRVGTFPLGSGGSGAGSATTAAPGVDRPLNLTADTGTNSLIAVGEPRVLAQLESLLEKLDVRQPQVMLEVMLVSLNDAQSLQLGVEIEKITKIQNTAVRLASLFGLSTSGPGGRVVGDAAGFTGTALNPGEFSLVVRALENLNNGRSLSSPQVLVNNNQQAVLSSVLQQPFSSTNASTTVATTSFGGTQDAGTTLTIRPQIAEGDHLVLQYSVALSSFVGAASSTTLPPPRQQNTVQSTVTIPDGYTVVVGGLELESESKSTAQIPVLGDIPLVGELFKNRDNTRSKTKFFVFIHAGVMRSGTFEDLKYVSDAAMVKMGVDDGFPEVEPLVIR